MVSIGRVLLFALLSAALLAQGGSPTRSIRRIAADTKWQTDAVVIDSGFAGPTVLVIGGVHGDEPAGYRAARQISGWKVRQGRLVVVPRANHLGLRAGTRRIPDLMKERSDLNRQFPTRDWPRPVGVLASALWAFVLECKPDVVLDLHEGFDFTQRNPKSVGSSVIGASHLGSEPFARAAQAAVNAEISVSDRKFVLKSTAIRGSLIRAVAERLEVPALIFETTTRSQAYAVRARQHRLMVHAVLEHLEMAANGPHVLLGDARRGDEPRVGMFSASGVSGRGPGRLEQLLRDRCAVRRFGARDLGDGVLQQFDVLLFPGGSGSGQAKALGKYGRDQVRSFVRDGGGYVGICAGGYLAANNYDWSLGILDANVIDRKHWARGRGTVSLRWAANARGLLGQPRKDSVLYANGPIYARGNDTALPDFEVLASYRSEVNRNGAPKGVMLDTPAIVRGTFGKGRVVCSSPHPEQTEGLEEVMRRLVLSAAGR